MLGRIRRIFGSKPPPQPEAPQPEAPQPPPRPRRRPRVSLKRRYPAIAEMAHGSMSKVYRAIDNQSGRVVCLKVQLRDKQAAAAARSARAERPQEGEIAATIIHPHVVRTFDYGVSTRGEHFIVMEFIE